MNATRATFTIVALVALVAAGCGSSGGKPQAGPTVTKTVIQETTPAATPGPTVTVTKTVYRKPPTGQASPSAPSGANQIIARFNGSGTQNTPDFTTPSRWHLSWAYWGCPGGRSNFIVTEYNTDGSLDPNGIMVNELGTGRGPVATYAYGDAGTHYLSVNTGGCKWSLVPVTG